MSDYQLQRVKAILEKFANTNYIGEPVSQLEHSLQCAYFAEECGHSDEIIIASLLHDIGHVALATPQPQMENLGVLNHEWIGARLLLEMGFSNTIAQLVGHHVNAKRYLSSKKPAYFNRLSEASKGTLAFQGGPMDNNEMAEFESFPLFKEILKVRTHDEKGKQLKLTTPSLDHYLEFINSHLRKNNTNKTPPKKVFTVSDYPLSTEKVFNLCKSHDFDIALCDKPQPILSPLIFDYSLSQLGSQNQFVSEIIQLIHASVLNRYLLITKPDNVSRLAEKEKFELIVI